MSQKLIIDSSKQSWINYPANSDFPIQNLPLSVFSTDTIQKRSCTIIGDSVIDLYDLAIQGFLILPDQIILDLSKSTLNDLFSNGKNAIREIRKQVSEIFGVSNLNASEKLKPFLHPIATCKLHLPIHVGDYTDFYSSREHATNVGIMFRDPANALFPNWLNMPIGYHGRASSIIVSGTPVKRPKGQTKPLDTDPPIFGPSKQLDFELEMAFVIGKSNKLGDPVLIQEAEEHIQGLMLFNDWSARDIQKWEYIPLGPFLGKNFASSISPWIIDLDAIEPFRTKSPIQDPVPLAYLQQNGNSNFDINLEVYLNDTLISKSNTKYLYWSMAQQLAHHTLNGCNMQIGDLCASGTISGPVPESFGSMLELAWKGTKPITLKDGSTRTFLLDGDILVMKAFSQAKDYRIGFGEVRAEIIS